ncbi:MAG TPA: tetratricopeptide repeat protein [Sedimenticola sp.]|nr:tetratricopeptide repeat protein [Sedimenticola sp.]
MLRIFLIGLLLFSAMPALGDASLSVGAEDASLEGIKAILEDGRPDDAMKQLDSLLKKDPDNPEARFLKGLILVNQNKLEESIEVFEALTKDYPDLPEPYNNLAVSYSALGRFDEARKALQAAITTHPSYATAHENLGNIYAMMAAEAYDQALALDEGNHAARDKLALMNELFSVVPMGETLPAGAGPDTSTREEKAPSAKFNKPSSLPPEEDPELSIPLEAEASPEENPEPAAPATAEAPPRAAPASNTASNLDREVLATAEAWARAWSHKDLDGYLGFYHPSRFKPSKGLSRAAWEKQRRRRLSKPRFIKVTISYPAVKSLGNGRARITFTQTYRSNTYRDKTKKSLDMEKSEDGWKIVREAVLK